MRALKGQQHTAVTKQPVAECFLFYSLAGHMTASCDEF